jgi:hypothetical protein
MYDGLPPSRKSSRGGAKVVHYPATAKAATSLRNAASSLLMSMARIASRIMLVLLAWQGATSSGFSSPRCSAALADCSSRLITVARACHR